MEFYTLTAKMGQENFSMSQLNTIMRIYRLGSSEILSVSKNIINYAVVCLSYGAPKKYMRLEISKNGNIKRAVVGTEWNRETARPAGEVHQINVRIDSLASVLNPIKREEL